MKKGLSTFRLAVLLLIVITATSTAYAEKAAYEKGKSHSHILKREALVAKWKAGEEEFTFDKSGTSLIKTDTRECPGTWALKGKTLTITPKKLMYKKDDPCSKTRIYEVVSSDANTLEIAEKSDNKQLHLTRQK